MRGIYTLMEMRSIENERHLRYEQLRQQAEIEDAGPGDAVGQDQAPLVEPRSWIGRRAAWLRPSRRLWESPSS